jgi:hypothetical protein
VLCVVLSVVWYFCDVCYSVLCFIVFVSLCVVCCFECCVIFLWCMLFCVVCFIVFVSLCVVCCFECCVIFLWCMLFCVVCHCSTTATGYKPPFSPLNGSTAPSEHRPPLCGSTITLGHTALGRTPLDQWSARCRDLYLTTHENHKRQTSVPQAGFEPAIPANERALRPTP